MQRASDSRLTIHTTWGPIHVTIRDGAVRSCALPRVGQDASEVLQITRIESRTASPNDRATLRAAERFVRSALKGRASESPPLADGDATPFTAACRRAMRKIRLGRTVSYAELSRRAGSPGAARGAGQVCARNPLPLFIPCHRVLAADGQLGGFSAGLRWKVHLLEAEARA